MATYAHPGNQVQQRIIRQEGLSNNLANTNYGGGWSKDQASQRSKTTAARSAAITRQKKALKAMFSGKTMVNINKIPYSRSEVDKLSLKFINGSEWEELERMFSRWPNRDDLLIINFVKEIL